MKIVTAMQRRYQDSGKRISHSWEHYYLKGKKKLRRTREQGMIPMNQTVSNCGFHRTFCRVLFFGVGLGFFW